MLYSFPSTSLQKVNTTTKPSFVTAGLWPTFEPGTSQKRTQNYEHSKATFEWVLMKADFQGNKESSWENLNILSQC